MRHFGRYSAVAAVAALIVAAAAFAAEDAPQPSSAPRTVPKYNDKGELILPEGYREWVFVGSALGLSYSDPKPGQKNDVFHNVYIQPEVYREYMKSGVFPEKTMLAMELFKATEEVSPAKGGQSEGEYIGMEMAVKDKEQLKDGWGYFNFIAGEGKLKPAAKAFPRSVCFECHLNHGGDDNVFTQFYPILKRPDSAKP